MDNLYFDEIHKGGKDTKSMLIKAGIIAGGILLLLIFGFLTFTQFGQFAFLFFCGTIFGMYYLLKYRSKEYEYIFTNGEIDIDIISGRISRKRCCTIKPQDVEVIAKYSDEEYKKQQRSVVKTLDLSSGIKEKCYILVVNLNHTKMMLIISPSERLIEAWKPYLKKLDFMMRFNNNNY